MLQYFVQAMKRLKTPKTLFANRIGLIPRNADPIIEPDSFESGFFVRLFEQLVRATLI